MLDLDLTLRRVGSRHIEEEVVVYLGSVMKRFGFSSINLVTNNIGRLHRYANPLNANIFQPFFTGLWLVRKPRQEFYKRILIKLSADPKRCVMIGDKIRADVMGAKRFGMYTVLVNPRGRDYLYDRLILTRYRQRKMLQNARKNWKSITKPTRKK